MVEALARDMERNVANGYDNVVVIDGVEGSGKSNLAYALCCAYDHNFDIERQYVYDIDNLKARLNDGDDRYKTFWLDEGSNIANNRDWQTKGNKDLVAILEMMRSRGWTLVFCIPTIERLDVYIRDHRVRYSCHCAPCTIGKHDYPRGGFELRKRGAKSGHLEYVGWGTYPKMPAEANEVYQRIKLESQTKRLKRFVNGEEDKIKPTTKKRIEDLERRDGHAVVMLRAAGMSVQDIAELFGRDDTWVYNKTKRYKEAGGE